MHRNLGRRIPSSQARSCYGSVVSWLVEEGALAPVTRPGERSAVACRGLVTGAASTSSTCGWAVHAVPALSPPGRRVARCPRTTPRTPTRRRSAGCWPRRSRRSAARSGRARSRWPRRSPRRWPAASTCSSRPAPAPASRWPTSCPRCSTTAGSSSPPRPWRSSTSWSSATSRGWSRRSGDGQRRSTRRTPCSRAAPTTPACTASARACPTTRARWSRCRRARWPRRCSSCGPGPRRRPSADGSGERDNAPRHTDREWRQVSVNHRECLGATKCPFGQECFAELAREKAHRSHLIVTNHSLLAIDAIEGVPMIPDYDVVVIDEAHELVARVTQAATDELAVADVERAARRSQRHVGEPPRPTTSPTPATRCAARSTRPARAGSTSCPSSSRDALVLVRDAARALPLGLPARGRGRASEADAGRTQAKGMVQEVFVTAERMAADSDSDVLWLTEGGDRIPPRLCVAPLQVWGPMRDKLLTDKTVVFTSATLMLGGDFSAVAVSVGLKPAERVVDGEPGQSAPTRTSCPGAASTSGRRSTTASRRSSTSPATCRRPAATASARPSSTRSSSWSTPPRAAPSGCSAHGARPRRRRPRGPRAAAAPDHAGPGRRPAARAGPAVRRGPAHLPVRHAQPVAGPRRARRDLPAGDHRPDPVPAARRPADVGAAARGRPGRRQRLHAGRRHPRRAAARAGLRPADPHADRPRRGRRPRPAAGHRALRRLPQGQPAADVDHDRPRRGAQGAEAPGR